MDTLRLKGVENLRSQLIDLLRFIQKINVLGTQRKVCIGDVHRITDGAETHQSEDSTADVEAVIAGVNPDVVEVVDEFGIDEIILDEREDQLARFCRGACGCFHEAKV